MAQDNTKLCDFTNTNNNDFISTSIAPLTDAESCEINAALLNLVMKDPFSGLPSEDAATHLNSFVDLCDMQKKKDVDNDIVKLKLFPFSLRDRAKAWFSSLPKNSIDSWYKCKDDFISKYFCRCQNRRISGRGSRTVRLGRMVTGGREHDVLPRFGPS